jgi:copper homeostasis protein
MSNYILEIACFNVESAIVAAKAGASRIEFCEDYAVGGITPSQEHINQVKRQVTVPVYVMIRPRGGDFIYTEEEFEVMKKQVTWCKQNNLDGIVFGMLTKQRKVDDYRCRILIHLAHPMKSTFHRAIDETEDIDASMETIISCGFHRILTSGKQATAVEGATTIRQLINQADNRIIILPGGGIRSDNIAAVKETTGAAEFHSAALEKKQTIANSNIIKGMLHQMESFKLTSDAN